MWDFPGHMRRVPLLCPFTMEPRYNMASVSTILHRRHHIYRWVSARKTQLQQWSYVFFALTHRYFASDGKVWGVNCAMISVFLILHNAAYNTAISAVEYISQIHAITVTSHEWHGVSNRLQLDCLFNNMFQLTTPVLLRANNAERVSLPWYHHVSDTEIDPSHKFHSATSYKNVHTFLLQNGALWDMGRAHCRIWELGQSLCCMQLNIISHRVTAHIYFLISC